MTWVTFRAPSEKQLSTLYDGLRQMADLSDLPPEKKYSFMLVRGNKKINC